MANCSLQIIFLLSLLSCVICSEEECMKQYNISKDTNTDEAREDKCFLACFLKENAIMDDKGQLIKEKMIHYFKQVQGNQDKCIEALLNCVDSVEKENDDCEKAHKFDLCMTEKEEVCAM